MENIVLNFDEFINEDLNYTKNSVGIIELEDRWFYYDEDDDIIYGTDELPSDITAMFAINPSACKVMVDGKIKGYDVNNPACLVKYDMVKEALEVYTEYALEYLQDMGIRIDSMLNISDKHCQMEISDKFENDMETRHILIYGNQLIASTFDIIEEN